nr:DUF4097 family beta strand repeat-containing protein [Paenibacillus sp. GSMTC-2017]
MEEKYDLDDIKHLSVEDSSINITVLQGNSSQAVVRMEGSVSKNLFDDYKLEGQRDGDTLHIRTKSGDGWNWFTWSTVKLTIELPPKQWEEVTINSSSGNITVDQLLSAKLSLKTSSGNIKAEKIDGHDLSLRTSSGNIKLLQATGDELELKSSSGNITIEEYKATQLDLHSVSGNIKAIEGTSEIVAQSTSGNITIESDDLLYDADLKSTSGNVSVALRNDPTSLAIDFNAGSGIGKIKKDAFVYEDNDKDRDDFRGAFGTGDTKLKVRTSSGNFTLK